MHRKGAMRRREVSKRWRLAERWHGASPEARIALRGTLPLAYLPSSASQSSAKPPRRSRDRCRLQERCCSRWERRTCVPSPGTGEPQGVDGATRNVPPTHHLVCVLHGEHGRLLSGCAAQGEVVRGQHLTKAQCQRGASDGAEESADGKAVHTARKTHGEGPSPAERPEQRDPANAQAVHGVLRVCWRNAKERFMVSAMEKDRRC